MTSTTKKTSKASSTKKPAQPSATIYIGPSTRLLKSNTIFKGGKVGAHIEKVMAECPHIKHLIVPATEAGKAQEKLKDPSSVESSFYKKIQKHFQKGAK